MKNQNVSSLLEETESELIIANNLLLELGVTSNVNPYISKYSIIRACGAIEVSFKSIIADSCTFGANSQISTYLNKTIRESSSNPSYDNICKKLKLFDQNWAKQFKDKVGESINPLKDSLKSLVEVRNDFAHGGNPTITMNDIIQYYKHGKEVIEILDTICS